MSLSKTASLTGLHASELFLMFFGILLVVGLVGEYRVSWEGFKKTFELMVIIGVAGELIADGGIFLFSEHLQTIADTDISATNERAGKAFEEGGKANERAAASELKASTLEAEIQPRFFTEEQQHSIAGQLRRLRGRKLLIASQWIDAEAAQFARQLKSVLSDAGIGVGRDSFIDRIGAYPEIPGALFGGGGFSGPNIHTGVEVWGADRVAVEEIARVLRSTGKLRAVTTPLQSQSPFDRFGSIPIAILVGVKPTPDVK